MRPATSQKQTQVQKSIVKHKKPSPTVATGDHDSLDSTRTETNEIRKKQKVSTIMSYMQFIKYKEYLKQYLCHNTCRG